MDKRSTTGRLLVAAFLGGAAAVPLWWFVLMPVGLRIGIWLAELVAGA